ncbi:hypothetical protein TPHA_0O01930 [Tetrapisispora phaffii CBS 4417]|uniref:Uncharacterized protein n=1 Tax=Tetrapisispora phaffii (strain ATCC 24235 / CBS 4417 / NBRC 1672 / NRRL Y-8282 / UCD 70-5) TaxID=1071381 RepID=G8C1Y1_TETPH|nr:hypothetical protein TPHA_0O01930 [Tetrapisispora phaffii CBS 4417]CCE66159.1 hypothetical protein TPHA_0O01930 [Tetrapisispora phaffii CBS 4417]
MEALDVHETLENRSYNKSDNEERKFDYYYNSGVKTSGNLMGFVFPGSPKAMQSLIFRNKNNVDNTDSNDKFRNALEKAKQFDQQNGITYSDVDDSLYDENLLPYNNSIDEDTDKELSDKREGEEVQNREDSSISQPVLSPKSPTQKLHDNSELEQSTPINSPTNHSRNTNMKSPINSHANSSSLGMESFKQSIKNVKEENNELKKLLEEKVIENNRLNSDILNSRNSNLVLQNKLVDGSDEITNLQDEVNILKDKLSYFEADNKILKNDIYSLESNYDELHRELNEWETKVKTLNKDIQYLQGTNAQLSATNATLSEEKEALTKEKEILLNNNDSVTKSNNNLIAEKELLVSERELLISEKEALTKEIEVLLKNNDNITKLNNSLILEKETLLHENEEITKAYNNLISERDDLLIKERELHHNNSTLSSEVGELIKKQTDLETELQEKCTTIKNMTSQVKYFLSEFNHFKKSSEVQETSNIESTDLNDIEVNDDDMTVLEMQSLFKRTLEFIKNHQTEYRYQISTLSTTIAQNMEKKDLEQKILNEKLIDKDNTLEEFKSRLSNYMSKLAELEARLDEINKKESITTNKLIDELNIKNDLNIKIKELEKYVTEKQDQIDSLSKDAKELNEKIVEKVARIKALEANLDTSTNNYENMQQRVNELEDEEKYNIELSSKVAHLSSELEGLRNQLNEEKITATKLKSEKETQNEKFTELLSFITGFEIFNLTIGALIMKAYKDKEKKLSDAKFNEYISNDENHSYIIGFKNREDEHTMHELQNNLTESEKEVSRLRDTIDTELKTKINDLTSKSRDLEIETKELKTEIEKKNNRIDEGICEIRDLKTQTTQLMNERKLLTQKNIDLSTELTTVKGNIIDNHEIKLQELAESLNKISTRSDSLQNQLSTKDEEIVELKKNITAIELINNEQKDKFESQTTVLNNLKSKIRKLEGNKYEKVMFDSISKTHPGITKKKYDDLHVDNVDSIDMVQLQNIVKNIILLFEIPLSKLTKKLPLIAIYIKYERTFLLNFANQLHYQIYNETIDIKRFINIVYTQYIDGISLENLDHPLESCLEDLYIKIKTRL